jgi:hypothetical protein
MKNYIFIAIFISTLFLDPLMAANSGLELPSWANSGNLENELSSTGQNVAGIISMVVALLAIGGMLVGAGFFTVGNPDRGKTFLFGGVTGLVLAGSVYGIAALFIN